MKVEKLTLRNFRNIEETTLTPDGQLNFLIGANGQGKTSILEALSYLSTLRSFRGARSEEVIRWDQSFAEICCVLSPDGPSASGSGTDWRTELKVVFGQKADQKASKVAFINGKSYRSSTQYLCQRFGSFELGFHSIVFNPADHDLVRGEPACRRSYLDRVLAAEDLEYLKALQKYHRVLEQRNALLRAEQPSSRELLAGFSEPLAQYGSLIAWKRIQWLSRVATRLNWIAQQIAPGQPELGAIYTSNWAPEIEGLIIKNKELNRVHFAGQGELPSLQLLEQSFWTQLSILEPAELRGRTSLVGPHRDDWAFVLGKHFLKGHGSQGEVRTALLALKLAEIELFRETTGHRPLLLLDDFSSELDRERRGFLLRFLSSSALQVFVTTTEQTLDVGRRFWVSNGTWVENDHGTN